MLTINSKQSIFELVYEKEGKCIFTAQMKKSKKILSTFQFLGVIYLITGLRKFSLEEIFSLTGLSFNSAARHFVAIYLSLNVSTHLVVDHLDSKKD